MPEQSLVIDIKAVFPAWVWERKYTRISDIETLKAVMVFAPEIVALDTETTSLDRMVAKILGFSFSFAEGVSYWVPVQTGEELQVLAEFVKNRTCIFYNANYDIPVLERHGVKIGAFEDAMCMVYLDDPNSHMRGLKEASKTYLEREMVELKSFFAGKKPVVNFELLDTEIQTVYACMDADATLCLYHKLQDVKTKYPKIWGIEMALVRGTIEMEQNGIDLDLDLLRDLSTKINRQIDDLKKQVFELAGHEFNTNSPMQVTKVLYEELKLPCKVKTKTGRPSANEEALKAIENKHKIVPCLLKIASLQQKLEGFVDALPGRINPLTGRVHCNFKQWNVTTGRYSSANPNLQNQPKAKQEDIEAGLIIRDAFVANPIKEINDRPGEDDWMFIDGDYSQIELRVAASLSGEPVWWAAYMGDTDVHNDTARGIFKTSTPTKDQRDKAKTGNFGMLTGQSGWAFAKEMNISTEAGEAFVESWYAALPELSKWMRIEREKSRKTGIAKTFWGRSRKMGLSSSNNINCSEPGIRGHWERSVCSHIIQGTAADIMKLAIVLVRRDLIKAGLYDDVKILLTVHDQLLFRAKKRVVRQAIPIIRNAMELKIAGWVPIKFEMSVGTRWGSCKKLKDTEYADL